MSWMHVAVGPVVSEASIILLISSAKVALLKSLIFFFAVTWDKASKRLCLITTCDFL